MLGLKENNDNNFSMERYEDFYSHHHFEPIPEPFATKVNEVIPRFGWAFDKVEELGGSSLLDLGCLDGSFPLTVAAQLGIQATGIDLTMDGVELAKARAKAFGIDGRTRFYQGAVEGHLKRLAEAGEKFDIVTFFELIEHVKDVPLLLQLIDRVLAPGGSVLCSTPAFESPLYGKDDEKNTCHIRLYTMADEDRDEVNKFGTLRHATSITREIGKDRIQEMNYYSHLINVHYK